MGDVFHTRRDFTPLDLNAEVTFEIIDISPDGEWVRFKHHKGSMQKGTHIDVDKINKQTMDMGWDKSGYNGANSTQMSQVLKNINGNFWEKVNVPGYMTQHPEEYDRLIKLGSNINESNDFDWIKDIDVTPIKNSGSSCNATYDLVFDYFIGKQPISYGDYYYSLDSHSGAIVWGFNNTDEYLVYATPFWDGNCFLPISIQGDMGDYEELLYMELPQFNYREELFNWLENVYPNIVASTISDLGPLPE